MGLVSCSGGTHLVDLAGASIAGLARSFKVNCVWQSDDQKLVLQNPPRSSGAVVVLSGVTNTQKWMTPDIFSCQRLLMLIRSVNNFIYSVKLANMLVLCLSIQHYVSTSPNATHAFPFLKVVPVFTTENTTFSLFRWQRNHATPGTLPWKGIHWSLMEPWWVDPVGKFRQTHQLRLVVEIPLFTGF